jgi:uncharacterized protein YqjF (DUF2071 family)
MTSAEDTGAPALRQRPSSPCVGRQRWSNLLFAHWKVDPGAVQATLPRGLRVDTFENDAYVGIVPFFMQRVRPAWLPPLPWISWFLELNVRTYVRGPDGRAGVWFYSLDCNQPVAVAIARRFFHLPYFHARMRAKRFGEVIEYECQRRGTEGAAWRYAWSPGADAHAAVPRSLDFFLVERYVLFTADRAGGLHAGCVHHAPYRIQSPAVARFSTGPAQLAGFDLRSEPDSLLGALPVDVRIYPLQSVRT